MNYKPLFRAFGLELVAESQMKAMRMENEMLRNSERDAAEANKALLDGYRKCMELMREQMRGTEEAQRKCEMERLRANKAEMELAQCQDKLTMMQADLENTERILQQMRHRLNSSNGRLGGYKKSWNHKEKKQQKQEQKQ